MSATMNSNRRRNTNKPHMYNRGGYPNNNYGGRHQTPEPEPQSSSPVRGIYSDPQTAMVMCSILGTQTTVKTRNRSVYKGHTTGFSEKGDIAMCDAKLDDENCTQDQNLSGIIIPKDVFVVCKTVGVDVKSLTSSQDFTDAGIASRINGSTDSPLRELQPWQDDDGPETSMALESVSGGGWEPSEMFQVNSEKFNVKSSYSEDLLEYTTKLPTPDSEGYEERARFAQKQAEEIERSEGYQNRISKELDDGDEESKFSSVHRGEGHMAHRSHESNSSGKNTYTIPALRGDSEPPLRNGNPPRSQGRGMQRQNSPYSSTNHGQQQQQQHHMHQMNARQMNNHYHQGPPPPQSGPLNRGQGPPMHQRQQQQQQQNAQNHSSAAHSHQYHQQPPHGGPMSNHHPQQIRSPHQQHVLPQQGHQQKSQHPQVQSIPQHPPQQQQMPPQMQHSAPQKMPPHQQPMNLKHAPPNINGSSNSSSSSPNLRQHNIPQPHNGDGQQSNAEMQKVSQMDVNNPTPSQAYHRPDAQHVQQPTAPSPQKIAESPVQSPAAQTSNMSESELGTQSSGPVAGTTTTSSPSAAATSDRRTSRGVETNTEESRNKVNQQLLDFRKNFVLESQDTSSVPDTSRQESHEHQGDTGPNSQVPPASVSTSSSSSSATESTNQTSESHSDTTQKTSEKSEDEPSIKSTLNPMAKEFKPSVPKPAAAAPAPVEAQSPSPQSRSPHYVQQVAAPYANYFHTGIVPMGISGPVPHTALMPISQHNMSRKKATVSVGPVGEPLTAHQVTGQPLMATQPVILQPLPASAGGYQVINMGNPPGRMMAPNSITMGQGGQHANLEQAGSQNQPQPVFMTQQLGAIPAHLPPHPQPAHAQPIPHPTSTQAQTVHAPNPAPSPVQQHHNAQSLPHHMSQGPPQSATPQPSHYPQMNTLQHNIQQMPRTSMAGQQNITSVGGHPSGSISYPLSMSAPQYSYPNASAAQYTYAPAPQPQTSQNSNHGPGPQPQYVVMPQPGPAQGHPPMQQHATQPYAATGIQFQAQHNIMQGPPQMPPNAGHNPGQGGPHLIHSGMQGMPAGMHPQVSGTPPGMFMQMPQQFQHQQ